jgi:hypothetical protein
MIETQGEEKEEDESRNLQEGESLEAKNDKESDDEHRCLVSPS